MFRILKKYLDIDFYPYNASFFDFLKLEFIILASGGNGDIKKIGLIDMLFVIPAIFKMAYNIVKPKIYNSDYTWYVPLFLLLLCIIASIFTTFVSAVITLISSPFVFFTQQYYHRAGNRLRQLVSKINVVPVSKEEITDVGFREKDYMIEKSKLLNFMISRKSTSLYFKDYISNSLDKYYCVTRDKYCEYMIRPIILKDNKNLQLIFGIFKIDHLRTSRSLTALLFIGKNEFSSLKSLLRLTGIEYPDSNPRRANARRYNPESHIFTLGGTKFEAEYLHCFLPKITPLQELRQIPILAQLAVVERAKEAIRGSELTKLENAIQPLLSTINSMAGLRPLSNEETNQLTNFRNRYFKTYSAHPFPLQTEPKGVDQNTPTYSSS